MNRNRNNVRRLELAAAALDFDTQVLYDWSVLLLVQ